MKVAQKLESACKAFEADLVLFYYGDIQSTERRRIETHCQACVRCRRFLDDLQRLLPKIAKPKELPADFWEDYYSETMRKLTVQQAGSSWWRNLLAPMHMWLIPAFGTAAVAILAVTLVTGKSGLNLHLTARPQEVIPQEILADSTKVEFFKSMDLLESLGDLERMEGAKEEPSQAQQL